MVIKKQKKVSSAIASEVAGTKPTKKTPTKTETTTEKKPVVESTTIEKVVVEQKPTTTTTTSKKKAAPTTSKTTTPKTTTEKKSSKADVAVDKKRKLEDVQPASKKEKVEKVEQSANKKQKKEKVVEKVEKVEEETKEEATTTTTTTEEAEKKKNKRKEAKTDIEITLRKEDITITEEEFKKCFHDAVKIYRGSKRCVIVHLRDAAQLEKYLSKEAEDGTLIPLNKNFVEVGGKIFEVKRAKVKDVKRIAKKKAAWDSFK